jgi:general secretion pathway protein K
MKAPREAAARRGRGSAALRPLANQAGAALIAGLLAAALVSTLAAAMIFSQEIDIRRSGNIFHGDQAYLYALGVESWATMLLGRAEPGEEHEYLGRPLPPIMVVGGQVGGRVDDLQGLFNLNNLVLADEETQERQRLQFRRLLAACGLGEDLEQAVSDWLDADQEPRFPGGAEDSEYLRRDPPYRTADRPLIDPGELARVYGFDSEEYEQCLKPLVTALPEVTALNINTAPAPLLASLSDQLDLGGAEQLLADRPTGRGYLDLADFLAHPALAGSGLSGEDPGLLAVQSRYFMVQSEAIIGQSRVALYSVLKREGDAVRVLRRNR